MSAKHEEDRKEHPYSRKIQVGDIFGIERGGTGLVIMPPPAHQIITISCSLSLNGCGEEGSCREQKAAAPHHQKVVRVSRGERDRRCVVCTRLYPGIRTDEDEFRITLYL